VTWFVLKQPVSVLLRDRAVSRRSTRPTRGLSSRSTTGWSWSRGSVAVRRDPDGASAATTHPSRARGAPREPTRARSALQGTIDRLTRLLRTAATPKSEIRTDPKPPLGPAATQFPPLRILATHTRGARTKHGRGGGVDEGGERARSFPAPVVGLKRPRPNLDF
jgi:hypothetical protein